MVSHSFAACGIAGSKTADMRPTELLEGQDCSDSEDEHDNPFTEDSENPPTEEEAFTLQD